MAYRKRSFVVSFRHNRAAARFVKEALTKFPELRMSIMTTQRPKSEGYFVDIVITAWSGDTETLNYFAEQVAILSKATPVSSFQNASESEGSMVVPACDANWREDG